MADLAPPPTIDGWREILGEVKQSAWHLEMRDVYSIAGEVSEFEAWRNGDRDDPDDPDSWWRPWLDLMSETSRRGVDIRRVRIVSEPVTEYILFEHDGTFTNVAAGENVRWLPRRDAADLPLPAADLWLFDPRLNTARVMFSHFSGDGEWLAVEYRTEPDLIEVCKAGFSAAWARATPHGKYDPRNPPPCP